MLVIFAWIISHDNRFLHVRNVEFMTLTPFGGFILVEPVIFLEGHVQVHLRSCLP
jgi:hypothetical protein